MYKALPNYKHTTAGLFWNMNNKGKDSGTRKADKSKFSIKDTVRIVWGIKPIKYAVIVLGIGIIANGILEQMGSSIFQYATSLVATPITIAEMKNDISSMQDDISTLQEDLKNTNEAVLQLNKELSSVKTDLALAKNDLDLVREDVNLLKESAIQSAFLKLNSTADIKVERGSSKMEYVLASPTWLKTDVIAKSFVTQKEYTAADLVDKPLLLTYVENGQDVVFMGQFNENNHWNESCVVNVYDNGRLVVAMDAMYDDGVLLSYKQVRMDTSSKGKSTWVLSTKVARNEYNTGDSWTYLRTKDYYQELPLENIQPENVITYEKFLNMLSEPLEGVYHGNTSDGLYNDETGEAYLVKYNEDGFVTLLYQGNFQNGFPSDDTGNAWYITKNANTEYMYYKGTFLEGKPANNPGSNFQNPINIDEIEELLKGKEFVCELNWEID